MSTLGLEKAGVVIAKVPVMLPIRRVLLALVCVLLIPAGARADSILFSGNGTGEDGIKLNAAARFSISDNILRIKLQNTGDTSGSTKDKSANTLTGLFFDLPTGITLTPVKASIAPGDLLQGNLCDIGPCNALTTNVGGEFAGKYHTSPLSGHLGNYGISSSGYIAAVNGGGNFNGPNLDQPDSPDGINFGIVAPITASNPFLPKTGNMTDNPLIEGEVVFVMAISGGTLLESQISNVSFQYGTDIKEPKFMSKIKIHTIPEPVALLLLAPAAALSIRRRIRAAAAV